MTSTPCSRESLSQSHMMLLFVARPPSGSLHLFALFFIISDAAGDDAKPGMMLGSPGLQRFSLSFFCREKEAKDALLDAADTASSRNLSALPSG